MVPRIGREPGHPRTTDAECVSDWDRSAEDV